MYCEHFDKLTTTHTTFKCAQLCLLLGSFAKSGHSKANVTTLWRQHLRAIELKKETGEAASLVAEMYKLILSHDTKEFLIPNVEKRTLERNSLTLTDTITSISMKKVMRKGSDISYTEERRKQ